MNNQTEDHQFSRLERVLERHLKDLHTTLVSKFNRYSSICVEVAGGNDGNQFFDTKIWTGPDLGFTDSKNSPYEAVLLHCVKADDEKKQIVEQINKLKVEQIRLESLLIKSGGAQ